MPYLYVQNVPHGSVLFNLVPRPSSVQYCRSVVYSIAVCRLVGRVQAAKSK